MKRLILIPSILIVLFGFTDAHKPNVDGNWKGQCLPFQGQKDLSYTYNLSITSRTLDTQTTLFYGSQCKDQFTTVRETFLLTIGSQLDSNAWTAKIERVSRHQDFPNLTTLPRIQRDVLRIQGNILSLGKNFFTR